MNVNISKKGVKNNMEGKLRAFFAESNNGEEDYDENGQNKVKQ